MANTAARTIGYLTSTMARIFKSGINLNDQAYILSGTVNPSSSATDAPRGSIYLRDDAATTIYLKTDTGSSTNWEAVVSGPIVNADIDGSAAIAGSKLQAASSSNVGTVSYEASSTGTWQWAFAGGSNPTAPAYYLHRVGKSVTLSMAAFNTTASNATGTLTLAAGTIPSAYRPPIEVVFYVTTVVNGVATNSKMVVSTDGSANIRTNGISTDFPSNGGVNANGLNNHVCAAWTVA